MLYVHRRTPIPNNNNYHCCIVYDGIFCGVPRTSSTYVIFIIYLSKNVYSRWKYSKYYTAVLNIYKYYCHNKTRFPLLRRNIRNRMPTRCFLYMTADATTYDLYKITLQIPTSRLK